MSNIKLIDLLGEPISTSGIQRLLADLKIKSSEVKFTDDKFTAYATNEKRGVELLFRQDFAVLEDLNDSSITQTEVVSEKIKNMKNHPEGTLFLTAIAIKDNYILDNGYDINQLIRIGETSIAELSNLFGEPSVVNEFFNSMFWFFKGQGYSIIYDENTLKVKKISFSFLY